MEIRPLPKTLWLKFVSAILPIALILAVGEALAFTHIIDSVVQALSQRFVTQQVYYDRSRTLYPLLQELALARKLARSPSLIEWAVNESDPAARKRGLAELESFRGVFKDKSYFFAIDRSGNYYFNDAENSYARREFRYTLSEASKDDRWYFQTKKNQDECQLNVNNDTELQVTKIWINCLVRQNETIVGVVGTGIELTNFVRDVLNQHQEGVVNMFVDQDGAIQAHPDIRKIDLHTLTKADEEKSTVFKLLDSDGDRERLRQLLARIRLSANETGADYAQMGGAKVLVGVAYMPEIGWFNITVMKPDLWVLGHGFIPLALLMGVSIVLTILAISLLLHRLVLRRIGRLDRAVAKLKDYDDNSDLRDDSQDEIGRLTNSFVDLSEIVRKNRQNLKQEVEDRTRDLIAARDEAQRAEHELAAKTIKLEQSNADLEQFAYVASHDLREPLRMITSFLTLLTRSYEAVLDERGQEYIGHAVSGAKRMDALIKDLLVYSRVETMGQEPAVIEANAALQDALDNLHVSIADSHAEIHQGKLPPVKADRMQLVQLFQNLIGNALKYVPEGKTPRVAVSAQRQDRMVVFSVQDNGIGIDPVYFEKIFVIFQRLHGRSEYSGTGIGLAVCKRIVERHGGKIWVESQPDQGTCFHFSLPAAE